MLFGVVVLLALMRISAGRKPDAPPLAADCRTAAFALSTHEVRQARPVSYTIVGVTGRQYALGLDAETFTRAADGRWTAVPKPGREDSLLVPAGAEPLRDCTRSGVFLTPVPAGEHTVTLFELRDDGAVAVAEQALVVTEP